MAGAGELTTAPGAAVAAERRRRIAWRACLCGSLLLHGALSLLGLPAPVRAGGPRLTAMPLQVRQITAAESAESAARADEASLRVLPQPAALQPMKAFDVDLSMPESSASQEMTAVVDSAYLPRSELDQPPRPLAPIDLPWPEDGPPAGHFSEAVSLFIDESGAVQRVRIDGPGLPDALQAVVQQVFLAARFSPGMRDGRPMRSWIRIEVLFDAPSTATPRGVRR